MAEDQTQFQGTPIDMATQKPEGKFGAKSPQWGGPPSLPPPQRQAPKTSDQDPGLKATRSTGEGRMPSRGSNVPLGNATQGGNDMAFNMSQFAASQPREVQSKVVNTPAHASPLTSVLGTLATAALGVATGGWAPLIGHIAGSVAGKGNPGGGGGSGGG